MVTERQCLPGVEIHLSVPEDHSSGPVGLLSGEELVSSPRIAPWVPCAPGEGSRRWRGRTDSLWNNVPRAVVPGLAHAPAHTSWGWCVCLASVAGRAWSVSDGSLQIYCLPLLLHSGLLQHARPFSCVKIGSKFATKREKSCPPLAFSFCYDVAVGGTGSLLGAEKRRGCESLLVSEKDLPGLCRTASITSREAVVWRLP